MRIRRAVPLLALLALVAAGCTRPRAPAAPTAPTAPTAKAAPVVAAPKAKPKAFDPHQVLGWPRLRADRFGCMLQRRFGHRDPKFNCDLKGYQPQGDPCHDTRHYYEGPAFPDAAIPAVDPRLEAVELHWEHGELQAATLTFRGKIPVDDLVHRFGLPTLRRTPGDRVLADVAYPKGHDNLSHLSIERCGRGVTCLDLEGFEHQGAGDVDCR